MKTLFLLRHASASVEASGPTDFERPLNPRGRKEALDLGRMMRSRNVVFDAIVASPAHRVVETIAGVAEGSGRRLDVGYQQGVYNASAEALLKIIREAGDMVERLLIVGHNPGLEQLLTTLAGGDSERPRAGVASGFPTATLAEISFGVDHWRQVGLRNGRIVSFVRPGDVDWTREGKE